jgi:predicted dehydrogenase
MILTKTASAARAAANDRIGVGFIGIGKRSCELFPKFLDHPELDLLAVCDVDAKRREHGKKVVDDYYAKAGPSRQCAQFMDHRELLSMPGVDAVVIATPDHWHCHQVIDACRAGKDIYCEKPLSLNLRESKTMIDVVRKYDRVFQTGSQQRTEYDGKFRTACEYIRSGRLGQIISAHVGVGLPPRPCDLPEEPMEPGLNWDRWLGPAPLRPYNSILSPRGGSYDFYPQWRLYNEYAGGQLADMGAHHFDIVQWALRADQSGPILVTPPAVRAEYGARLTYEIPGQATRVEVFHGGSGGVTFIGSKGVIAVDRDRIASIPETILTEALTDHDEKLPPVPYPKSHLQNWVDCIKSRQRCICDVEIGARSAAVCHLLNLAYQHRRPMEWDPDKWEFKHDPEANRWRDYKRRRGFELPSV